MLAVETDRANSLNDGGGAGGGPQNNALGIGAGRLPLVDASITRPPSAMTIWWT